MIVAFTDSVQATRQVAAAVAELVRPGDIILLTGDLGAGKTAFAQGFGAELGITEPITSPTYVLVHTYDEGRLLLNHLDVYRLEQVDEALDIGLAELLDDGGVTLIEWGDTIIPVLAADYLEIRLHLGETDDERRLEIECVGPRWAARTRALQTGLGPWLGTTPDGSL